MKLAQAVVRLDWRSKFLTGDHCVRTMPEQTITETEHALLTGL